MPHYRPFVAVLALLLAAPTVASAGPKAAIFPFELDRRQPGGRVRWAAARRDAAARAGHAGAAHSLRRAMAAMRSIDLSALAAAIAQAAPLHKCGDCAVDIARRAGADVAVTGTVRKISNLILGFTIELRDVASGRANRGSLQAASAAIPTSRGCSGIRWLVANRLLASPAPR